MSSPLSGFPGSYGLGMELHDWDGGTVIGHHGATIGQQAFLRMAPDAGVAVALLTNGGAGHGPVHGRRQRSSGLDCAWPIREHRWPT
ncbi:serine hydrolase [Nonomuraea sp. NPDC050643]|uniref:serine hydrolase n=1 Tax=Nonomuraea sp. NPDC050643 TaxID=3155660 RepID=UPI0033D19115